MGKLNQSGNAKVVMPVFAALIMVAAAALFASGCSGASQDKAQAAAESNSATTATTPGTTVKQASQPLPEDYPGDVARIYEPSTVTYAGKMGSGMTLQYMVVVETNDSVDVVAKSLVDHYSAQDVKVNQTPLNDEGVGQIVVSKSGYGIVITYSAGDNPDTTNITYNVKPQKKRS